MFFGIDQYYIMLVVPAFLFALFAQWRVQSTFSKYSEMLSLRGHSGASVARQILDANGLHEVRVEPVSGNLTDHYDPRTKVVRLSESVYHSRSVAAIGVAAHETGHALQHREQYAPLVLRSTLVPVANIGSMIGPYMAIAGLMFGFSMLTNLGIILFAGAVAFYLITLPVEFNASSRAVKALGTYGILGYEELGATKKVLGAAAMTYVASATVAMANLLRLVLLANNRRDE